MAKGLAVIQGRDKLVFRALEDGNITFGHDGSGSNSNVVSAAVVIHGSLKLATGNQADGYFLKSDASGQADWAQITTADISGLDTDLSVIDSRIDAVSAGLATEIARATGREDVLSAAIEANVSNHAALRSEFDALENEFDVLKGDFSVQTVLSNLAAIQEYLDGDGVSVAGVLSDIGDLTDFARSLSTQIGNLSTSAGGDTDALSIALHAADDALGVRIDDVSAGLATEISDRAAADSALSGALSSEIARAIAREDDLSAAIAANLSNSVVAVEGTAGETDVVYTEGVNGRTAKVGLTDSVSVAQNLTVGDQLNVGGQAIISANLTAQSDLIVEQNAKVQGDLSVTGTAHLQGDVNLGDSEYSVTAGGSLDSVQVNGTFRIPHLTRQQALDMYGNGTALNDQATTISNGHDGHMFYLKDSNAASDSDPLPEGNKWYFCENGVWHASFFYYA